MSVIDPKSKLQEYCLKKYKVLPKYSLEKRQGPQHSPIFRVNVTIPNVKKIFGKGNSIKKAQKLIKGNGRILVRKSGTEQKIRIMGESKNKILLKRCINIIIKTIN